MLHLNAYMASCHARDVVRRRTLSNLSATDWNGTLAVEFDDPALSAPLERHTALVRRILWRAAKEEQELFLFLEDDLDFNQHFLQNLAAWLPVERFTRGQHFYASLYNPGVEFLRLFPDRAYGEACPKSVVGSQALLVSRATARYMVTCWGVESSAHADFKLARLAARVCPIFYHVPSLVQHMGAESTWGGPFHRAADFDKGWQARALTLEKDESGS